MHIKMARTAKALSAWPRKLIPMGKMAGHICREVIGQLDIAQEHCALSEKEIELRKLLKNMLLGLAAIDRSRAQQKARHTWLKKGDINSKYFHIMANVRKTKNYIGVLKSGSEAATIVHAKHQMIYIISKITLAPASLGIMLSTMKSWVGNPNSYII
jgi:hypothetical protein